MIRTRYAIYVDRNVLILTLNMRVLPFIQRIITKLSTIYNIFSIFVDANQEIKASLRSTFKIRGEEKLKNGYLRILVAANRANSVKRRRNVVRKM